MSGNWSKSAFFEGGWVTLNADFRGKGASPTNHSWYQSSRVIALSCGIKISAVRHLILSQSTRVTDGRTDRITTPKTALAYARAVKTGNNWPPFAKVKTRASCKVPWLPKDSRIFHPPVLYQTSLLNNETPEADRRKHFISFLHTSFIVVTTYFKTFTS